MANPIDWTLRAAIRRSGALDMSREARMARAREQGFGDRVWYHGTNAPEDFEELLPGQGKRGLSRLQKRRNVHTDGLFVASNPERAAQFAGVDDLDDAVVPGSRVLPVRLRVNNPRRMSADEIQHWTPEELMAEGYDGVQITETGELVAFRPQDVRSEYAAFDPARSDSSNLLAGLGGAAVGAGLLAAPEEAEGSYVGRAVAQALDKVDDMLLRDGRGPEALSDWANDAILSTPDRGDLNSVMQRYAIAQAAQARNIPLSESAMRAATDARREAADRAEYLGLDLKTFDPEAGNPEGAYQESLMEMQEAALADQLSAAEEAVRANPDDQVARRRLERLRRQGAPGTAGALAIGAGVVAAPEEAEAAPMGTLARLTGRATQEVWHGSPARWADNRPSIARNLKSGEGTNVQGAGLYGAQNRFVAEGYGDNLYQLEVPAEGLLDWDAPAMDQPPGVLQALDQRIADLEGAIDRPGGGRMQGVLDRARRVRDDSRSTGADIYRALSDGPYDQREASRRLSEAGVPGTQYLDGASRLRGGGTRNVVMFDDASINPVSVNGQPIADLPRDFDEPEEIDMGALPLPASGAAGYSTPAAMAATGVAGAGALGAGDERMRQPYGTVGQPALEVEDRIEAVDGGLRGGMFDRIYQGALDLGLERSTAQRLAGFASGENELGLGAADFVPILGGALALDDFERDPGVGTGIGALATAVPVLGGMIRGGMLAARNSAPAISQVGAVNPQSPRAMLSDSIRNTTQNRAVPREVRQGAGNRGMWRTNPTVQDPLRVAYPDIYLRPDVLVDRVRTVPEDPMLQRLFGVTRDDLWEIAEQGRRASTVTETPYALPDNPKGARVAEQVMTRSNRQRLLDLFAEAERQPALYRGMGAWYEMDPAFERLLQISDDPVGDWNRFNALTAMASPGSPVLDELNRGTAALMLANQGRFEDFVRFGGGTVRGVPEDMAAVKGHVYHRTSQAGPMGNYVDNFFDQGPPTLRDALGSPKVPTYFSAAGVAVPPSAADGTLGPRLLVARDWPVGDAHWARGIGLADVRTAKNFGPSASTSEMFSLTPWYRGVASAAGLSPVSAQAIQWGALGPATGVETPLGAGKLELLAGQIAKAADRMGVSPEEARDMILTGRAHAGYIDPMMLLGLGAVGAGGALALSGED